MKSLLVFPALNKPAVEVLAVISAFEREVEAGASEVQAHTQLRNKFSASLGYMRSHLKKKKLPSINGRMSIFRCCHIHNIYSSSSGTFAKMDHILSH